ncbi:MAG TPA: hypothetical protein VKR79_00125 [Gaiellaceae bacterium]|nr:hypothetical protein [Gaiellaceae bacterium]
MRIVALTGVLVIALAGSALVFLRHSKPGTVTVASQQPTTPANTTALHSSPAPPRVKIVPPAVNPLLPGQLRAALARNPIVVVGLYDPQVREDSLTLSEARAGAAQAHAAFLGVNLLDDAVAGRLTALLPSGQLLPSPGILVYKRPGKVVFRFDGYLDRTAIAQAVDDTR